MKTKRETLASKLLASKHPARLWQSSGNGRKEVVCGLSPRNCRIPEGGLGFCRVRVNQGGELFTLNYGKSVQITREVIETEAVWHYAPGAYTLSIGNIGCNLHCDFCHNWRTSQAALVEDADIEIYTPEEIVRTAVDNGIRILSWTYNEPVVWHEFVLDAARLAQQHGLRNVYKSAFYITEKAVEELIDVIDVFSISLKSMDPAYYRKLTSGRLEPVLEAARQVRRSGRHLEVSNLMVTGRNDTLEESAKVARWVLENLGPRTPLHYVGFHPDYYYTSVGRTSISILVEARAQAKEMGLRHVYIGNAATGEGTNTLCDCGELLIGRYGLIATPRLTDDGLCPACGARPDIVLLPREPVRGQPAAEAPASLASLPQIEHRWNGEVSSLHIDNPRGDEISYAAVGAGGETLGEIQRCNMRRFMVSRSHPEEAALRFYYREARPAILNLLDRAYYPLRRDAAGPE